jgi:hypothetical protein
MITNCLHCEEPLVDTQSYVLDSKLYIADSDQLKTKDAMEYLNSFEAGSGCPFCRIYYRDKHFGDRIN